MAVRLRDRPWTYANLAALPDDGKRYEIVDGVLFEMPAPNIRHILTLSNLVALLSPVVAVAAVGARLVPAIADVFSPGPNRSSPTCSGCSPAAGSGWRRAASRALPTSSSRCFRPRTGRTTR